MKWTPAFYAFISALTFVLLCLPASSSQSPDCGGMVEGSQGTIQSPNFPGAFPVPISCRWIIHAPENSKIVIYFTQYYLRRSLFITEYDSYESPTVNENENFLGEINTEDRITSLVAYRPYVILSMTVSDGKNLNLRVEEFLADVHGFNITWLIVPREQHVKTVTCSAHDCSFLGNCMASADYSNYSCECFDGFYGNNCEKGPHCDWEKGRNRCLNGGKCRYFLGSLVNICDCPPGYNGVRCENRLDEQFDKECAVLKCSHHCEKSRLGGRLQCACDDGFSLNQDGVTCSEREQYRVSVSMPVKNQTHLQEHLEEVLVNLPRITQLGITLLHLTGLRTAEDFTVDRIGPHSVDIHFYVDKIDLERSAQTTLKLIRGDTFFGITIRRENIVVTSNPKIKLLSLENSDRGPALEGNLLTLSCIARGSKDLKFRWFKEGQPVNLQLTKRNAWEIRLPETMEEKHISVLNIDGVTIYDKGTFTCEIKDFNRTINRSVTVDVLEYPQIEVTPLTISAIKGQTYTFRCFAPDEKKRSFKYKWIKNNRPFDEGDEEKIEDLRPSGSRLLIKSARKHNNYSCIVTNRAGAASTTVFIFVSEANRSSLACPTNTLHGIRWNKTFGDCFSLRKCPTDAEDFNARRGIGHGYTKRRCTCKGSHCVWHTPSYTGCQSVHLINLYDQLRKIQLGYQDSQLTSVYTSLYQIASKARGRMYAGDLEITAQSLLMVLMTARDFPSLLSEGFNTQALVDFMSILLDETFNLTQDEKEEVLVGGRILQMAEVLVELEAEELVTLNPVNNGQINLKIEQFYKTVYNDMFLMSNDQKNITVIVRESQPSKSQQRLKRNTPSKDQENTLSGYRVVKMEYNQSLLQMLGITERQPLEKELFMSNVYSYIPLGYKWHNKQTYYLVDIPHNPAMKKYTKQTKVAYCLSWERMDREDTKGMWKDDSCFVVISDYNRTQCACPLPGHFTVVLIPGNSTSVITDSRASNLVLLVACGVSVYLTLIAIGSYLIAWRFLQTVRHSVYFNFILSVFGMNVVCLGCLLKQDIEILCVSGTILLQLFVVAAFTFLLLDAVKLCNEIYAETHATTDNEFWKFIIIGWGVPLISVVCMLVMIALVGSTKECHDWCWWHESQPHFYTVFIPVIILIVAHITMLVICLLMIRKWNNQWRYILRKKALLEIGRNKILLILLIICVCAGLRTRHVHSMGSKIFFLLSDIILTSAIVLLLCILNKPIRLSVRNCRNLSRNASQNFNIPGFRAIIQSGDHLEYSRAEAERMHEYCSRVDRERYTSKHKQKLRVLLNSSGSSASSGPSSSAILGVDLRKENWSSALQAVPSKLKDKRTNNVDSGISEGTDSEKSSTPPNDHFASEFHSMMKLSCQTNLIKKNKELQNQRRGSDRKGAKADSGAGSSMNLSYDKTSNGTQEVFSFRAKSLLINDKKPISRQPIVVKKNESVSNNVSLSVLPNHHNKEKKSENCTLLNDKLKDEHDTSC